MIETEQKSLRVVIYEGKGSETLDDDLRFDIFQTLLKRGYAVTSTRETGKVTPADSSSLLVLGAFTAATPSQAVSETDARTMFKDIQNLDTEAVTRLVVDATEELQVENPGGWKPWFPVIDYDRCTNCMQCLSFCLFDVYGVSAEGQIDVRNNNKCKTDCPACSRVCPEVAILFPKYRSGPINGDAVHEEDLEREKMKVDISSLLGGDIYAALRQRSERAQSRFTKERDDERALKERQRCLVKLKKQLDIPDSVAMSLPTLDEINQKAEEVLKAATNNDKSR